MNVLESRPDRPLRLRPWVLLTGAIIVIAAVLYLTNGSSPTGNTGSTTPTTVASGSGGRHSGGGGGTHPAGLYVRSTTPAAGAENVAPNTTISVTFSKAVSLHTASHSLSLSPGIAGRWVQSTPTTLDYQLDSPLIPSTQEVVTIPGGDGGVRGTNGDVLSSSHALTFDVAAGDTMRLQQLLAGLDYLPLAFSPSGPQPSRADLAQDQPGTFSWRWPSLPSELTSQWTQGTGNEITKAAVEAFESQNNIGVDGIAGPAVWAALINDSINGKVDQNPYVYVLVNKALPENLTLWNNGAAQYVGIPVNTGASGADTTDGSFAVFEHVRYSDMKGTNPDGSTYNDPNVPYASYFNGGDALHGFIRASYGSPQSNGCVEMSYDDAALVWPLTPIGTLVTVVGPNYGSAPPPTTTTTATAPPATTTTAPTPAPTTAPPAPTPAPAVTPAAPAAPPTTSTTAS